MIRYAATSTDERKAKIMRMLAHFNHNSDDIIRKFGIQIGASFIEVPMRLMKPPFLEYYAGQTILPYNGSWRLSDSNKFLLTKQPLGQHKWAIIYSTRSRTSMGLLFNLGKMVGMRCGVGSHLLWCYVFATFLTTTLYSHIDIQIGDQTEHVAAGKTNYQYFQAHR